MTTMILVWDDDPHDVPLTPSKGDIISIHGVGSRVIKIRDDRRGYRVVHLAPLTDKEMDL